MDVRVLDYKENWGQKNWYFWTVVLEKTLESPLDCKEIQPVHPKGSQSWMFIGRTDVEAETPILWPPVAKSWLIWKDPDVGKDWRQEEKGMTKDEMVEWHHWLNRHEFEQRWRRRWWRTGKTGVLQSMVLQRVRHDWVTNNNSTRQSNKYYYINAYMWNLKKLYKWIWIIQFSSVAQSCLTLRDSMDCSMPAFPVHHQLPEPTQTHVHRVGDTIQPSHSLLSPSPPCFNHSQHQGLFKWVSSSNQVAKILEFLLQH